MFKLDLVGCQLQGFLRIPPLIFSEFHTARWVWDFVVIGALCWVTMFTPLQVVEIRHAIWRGLYDVECVWSLVVLITRSLWWCALMVSDCIFVWGMWSWQVSSDKAICKPGILFDQLANVVCVHVWVFRVRRVGVRVECSANTHESDFLYHHSVHHILPITELCTPQVFITFEVIIDMIFWSDIGVSFRTSYHDNGKEVFDAELIAKHYLRYWLSARGKCYGYSAPMCFISACQMQTVTGTTWATAVACMCALDTRNYFTIDLLSCIPGYPLAAVSHN